MTTRTRRRFVFCCLVVAFALPLESVLLQAVSTPDAKTAAIEWASSLPADALDRVSDDLPNYPLVYRRAIMRALSPEGRSRVWRAHIASYIESHPDLSADAVALLQAAAALASPENLSAPTAAARADVKNVGDQLQALIGKDDAQAVLYRLGPRDGTFQSHEPASLRLSNWVREKFVALAAAMTRDCDCTADWGCDGPAITCKSISCTVDDTWPACGWLWNTNCDGACSSLMMGN